MNMSNPVFLLALISAIPALVGAQTVYEQTEANGSVTYSEVPAPNSTVVDLPEQKPVVTRPDPRPKATRKPRASRKAEPSRAGYLAFSVINPTHGGSVRANGGQLQVQLELQPPLRTQRGDSIRLRFDGAVQPDWPPAATAGVIADVSRGQHIVSAEVVASDGRVLAQTSPAVFQLLRASVPAAGGAN